MFLFLLSSERTLDRRSKLCKSNEKPNLLFYFLNPCIIAVPYQGTLNLRCSLPSRQSLKGTKKVDNNAKKWLSFSESHLLILLVSLLFRLVLSCTVAWVNRNVTSRHRYSDAISYVRVVCRCDVDSCLSIVQQG